jgi:hypothetical protein
MKVPSNVLNFATEKNIAPYIQFRDYYNHYLSRDYGVTGLTFSTTDDKGEPISFDEKEELMNQALKREILRVSGIQNFDEFPIEQWASNPVLAWSTFAVVSSMVDMILPESVIRSIGLYTEVRNIGWGDSALFEILPRDLFVVSKAGRAQRSTEMYKQFRGNKSIVPELRELTVGVSLYRVLSGHESLAFFVFKVVRSMETQVTIDAYTAFAAAMDALDNTATTGLRVAGYTQATLVNLCQKIEAWAQAKPVVVGTHAALVNVLPSDANYRYSLDDDYMKIGYVKTAFGYDLMAIPQVADLATPWGLKLADNRLWIIAPGSQKILKLVFEGSTMSNTDTVFQNANLIQKSVLMKAWGVAVVTNTTAAVITL